MPNTEHIPPVSSTVFESPLSFSLSLSPLLTEIWPYRFEEKRLLFLGVGQVTLQCFSPLHHPTRPPPPAPKNPHSLFCDFFLRFFVLGVWASVRGCACDVFFGLKAPAARHVTLIRLHVFAFEGRRTSKTNAGRTSHNHHGPPRAGPRTTQSWGYLRCPGYSRVDPW